MSLSRIELLLGWVAVFLGALVAVFTYYGNFITADSVQRDLVVFGVVLAVLAVGVTADSLLNWPVIGKVLLIVATLALIAITAISFVSFLYLPTLLSLGATILAFLRPFLISASQRR